MNKSLDKYRESSLQKLDEFMFPLPIGHEDVDKAARHILRVCRLSEHRSGDDNPLVLLESETELRAAETLQDRGFGKVELRKTGVKDKHGRFEIGWIFVGGNND